MKLDVRRTVVIGLAFFSISAFWQMYNGVVPLMLTGTFHMNEALSGAIMALDNVLALFLLPFFGALSDRCRSPMGRRMPFIVFGTLAAVAGMMALPLLDDDYFASPAPWKLAAFVAALLFVLVAMGTYRSPAVALMPDLTPKPLRSRGNAVINLMGAVGGIVYLAISAALYSGSRVAGLAHVDYGPLFAIVAAIMVASVGGVFAGIRENEVEGEVEAYEREHPEENLVEVDAATGRRTLPREVRRSLGFLLASIALWFIGYNAIETWFTTYVQAEWGMALGDASRCLIVCNAGAILAFIPVGRLSARLGRRRTISAGICLLAAGFLFLAVWTFAGGRFSPVLYPLMLLLGVAWACINVNSLPMVVEMCTGADTGRFTGYYYTFSMAAQTVTPVVAGWLMAAVGYRVLFVYATAFVAASFVTMRFVRHGDVVDLGR